MGTVVGSIIATGVGCGGLVGVAEGSAFMATIAVAGVGRCAGFVAVASAAVALGTVVAAWSGVVAIVAVVGFSAGAGMLQPAMAMDTAAASSMAVVSLIEILCIIPSLQPAMSSSCEIRPDILTRACLLAAAALPWYAVFSGLVGLYFYVLLAVSWVGSLLGGNAGEAASTVLLAVALAAVLPLGLLLLLAMPTGLVCAAFCRSPRGLFGTAVRWGCVVSMAFAALHAAIVIAGYVGDLATTGFAELWWASLLQVVFLLGGLAANWRAWRWLRRPARYGHG